MKAEELLEKCEEKINGRWCNWINWRFFRYSFSGEFKKIQEAVKIKNIKDNDLDKNEVETFIGICNNRIDRAKTFLRDVVTVLSVLIALLAVIASILVGCSIKAEEQIHLIRIWPETGWTFLILIILLLLATLLFLLLCHYRAQTHAWYAVKEGVLLMKKNK